MTNKNKQSNNIAPNNLGLDLSSALDFALNAQIFVLQGQFKEAKNLLNELNVQAQSSNSPLLACIHDFIEAWLTLKQTNKQNAFNSIKLAFEKTEKENIQAFPGFMQSLIIECSYSLTFEHQQPQFIHQLIQNLKFSPITPSDNPWYLKIKTFGHFSIEINGLTIDQNSRSNRRSVELLQTIVALGNQQVNKSYLSQILWPESEGDKANHALESLIHRTRKLVGHNVLTIDSGRVVLNKTLCWVDCWALNAITINDHMTENATIITQQQLLRIYQGPFLNHFEASFSLITQEQHRRKFLTLVKQLSLKLQQFNDELTIELWLQAIDREPHEEDLYFELAQFYSKKGFYSQAKRTYQRCQNILMATYNASPSEAFKKFAEREYL